VPAAQPTSGRTVTEADLDRLKHEQEEATRRYNEALTALDRAIQSPPRVPQPPSPIDRDRVPALNEGWRIVPDEGPELGTGWRRRLAGFIWRLVGPMLDRQHAFNANLVDHVNRQAAGDEDVRRTIRDTGGLLEAQLAGLATFQSLLVQYLQQLTPLVDTKDREVAGLARRQAEDARLLIDVNRIRATQAIDNLRDRMDGLERAMTGMTGGLSGFEDELQKRWEDLTLRERRLGDFQTTVASLQQAVHALRREVERAATARTAGASVPDDESPVAATGAFASATDSYKYVGFEDQFRGSQEAIETRLREYVPFFEGATDVLDVGCGRGEFLRLLGESSIGARGLDLNHEMVEVCRSKGFDAAEGDAVSYLRSIPDGSLGGLFAAQVIEHLQPDYLLAFLDVAYQKLRPGSTIILETINPRCWFAFFESYIRDITHVRPIHPDTLRYLLLASGFQDVDVRYREPYPEVEKLLSIPADADHAETFNNNVIKVNSLLFTHLDYAGIGVRR
jgi:SAM-dependent methyltransferase